MEAVSTVAQVHAVLCDLVADMLVLDYPEIDRLNTRLAAEEAIVNAIRHGHQCDPTRAVRVSILLTSRRVTIRVQDQGPGFDPEKLPDPVAPENLERLCGRGVFLMRATMTRVRFNARGNAVLLCKQRSA